MPVCPACEHALPPAASRCARCGVAVDATAPLDDMAPTRPSRLSQEAAWAAVIGPRQAVHYLRRFAALSRPGARGVGWHWPAFLAPPLWFLYRKMWGWAAIWALVMPLLLLLDGAIAAATDGFRIGLDGPALLVLVGVGMAVPALFAERLYLDHCNRLIRRTRRTGSGRHDAGRLAARGGTSDVAAAVAAVFAGAAALGVVGGLLLAGWVDYDKRVKIVEALRAGAAARAAVATFIDRRGAVPASWQAAGFATPPLPAHVATIDLDPRTGTIAIDTRLSKAEFGMLRLVPEVDGAERIVWTCHADAALKPFSPPACRGEE